MRKLFTKKALSFFLATIMALATMTGMFTFSASAAGITVTDWNASTVYLNNADDVQYFFNNLILDTDGYEGQTFMLTDDVDMDGKTITARVGNNHYGFSGIFNGQGHTISNISVGVNGQNAGLFGTGKATTPIIKNVSFENAYYDGAWQPGFFYGSISTDITIDNVFVNFKEAKTHNTGNSAVGGGLIGQYGTGNLSISNTVITGTVSMKGGGFVGAISSCSVKIENCAFYGDMLSTYSAQFVYTGGNFATLKHCIGLGTIEGSKKGTFSVAGKVNTTGTVISDPEISDYSGSKENTTVANLAKHARADMKGIEAQAILNTYGMTGFVATTTGYPMPKTLVKTSTPTPDANALTDYIGYQTTKVADGKFGLRLVGSLDRSVDIANYTNIGFKVVAFFENGDAVMAKDCALDTVYDSIATSYGTSNLSETGKYLFVQECINLPTGYGDITFEVTTYATDADGETMALTYRFVVDVEAIPVE